MAMETRFEGYFLKEIDIAMKRQRRFKDGITFVIPAAIDDAARLNELEGLQTLDLRAPGAVDDLVKIIKRDHQRRHRARG